MCQIRQLSHRFWDRSNLIVTEAKHFQLRQLPESFWNGGNPIATEVKPFQIRQLTEIPWDGSNLIATKVKLCQIRKRENFRWQFFQIQHRHIQFISFDNPPHSSHSLLRRTVYHVLCLLVVFILL